MAEAKPTSGGPVELQKGVAQRAFVQEGTLVAMPLCFPGVTVPIRADESHITALDVHAGGMIYGGTSGKAAHLFVAMLSNMTGLVLDMGAVTGADHCAAVCCMADRLLACVNGAAGGRILARAFQPVPSDVMQEGALPLSPISDLGGMPGGERIFHAVASLDGKCLVGITASSLFRVDSESGRIRVISPVTGTGRLVADGDAVMGVDAAGKLWRYSPSDDSLVTDAGRLPEGAWKPAEMRWARDARTGALYTADAQGRLFAWSKERGFGPALGTASLAPVGPMAVTPDGRLFGACGREMAHLFCYDPSSGKTSDLGIAVSALQRRRYGYVFGDAVIARNGYVVFGEDDDLGHLWLYFPGMGGA